MILRRSLLIQAECEYLWMRLQAQPRYSLPDAHPPHSLLQPLLGMITPLKQLQLRKFRSSYFFFRISPHFLLRRNSFNVNNIVRCNSHEAD